MPGDDLSFTAREPSRRARSGAFGIGNLSLSGVGRGRGRTPKGGARRKLGGANLLDSEEESDETRREAEGQSGAGEGEQGNARESERQRRLALGDLL